MIKKMRKISSKLLFTAVLTVFITFSCRDKEYFDQGKYEEIVSGSFPVANVDPAHTWETVSSVTVRATLKTPDKALYSVGIYDGNPATGGWVTLLADGKAAGQSFFETAISHPARIKTVYIALTGTDGRAKVYRRTIDGNSLVTEIGGSDAVGQIAKTAVKARPQSLRYCFEENFPEPGDFDYNDIVLSLTPETPGDNPYIVRLTVSLDAVGSLSQLAAAVRLKGIGRDRLLGVRTESEDWFDFYNRTTASINLIDNAKMLTTARNGDAVIYLFNDAHWAMKPLKAIDGSVARPYYNTYKDKIKPEDMFEAEDIAPRKCTVTIMFDSEATARSVCAANLDVFMIRQYNGGTWEIHTQPFKLDNAMFDYSTAAYNNPYVWALLLPGGTAYARETKPIGTVTGGNVIGGAFQTYRHSFGEWAQDRNAADDWYLYPERSMTY